LAGERQNIIQGMSDMFYESDETEEEDENVIDIPK
jgi:hypothetical protein